MEVKSEKIYNIENKIRGQGRIKGKVLVTDDIRFPYKFPVGKETFEKKGIVIHIQSVYGILHKIKKPYSSFACLKGFKKKLIAEFVFPNTQVPIVHPGPVSGVIGLKEESTEYKTCMKTVNQMLEKIVEKEKTQSDF